MTSFLVSEALRDLRRTGRVGVSAILLIALSLAALGGFWLLSLNLGRAIGQWRDRVRVVVYLREEPPAVKVNDLLRRIEALGGIQRVRYVSKNEALQLLKRSLGGQADVADQLPRNPLPASVEVTPDSDRATPEGTRELVRRLTALPEVEDVQGGAQWVEGLAQFQRLFQLVGLGVGAVLALAAILTRRGISRVQGRRLGPDSLRLLRVLAAVGLGSSADRCAVTWAWRASTVLPAVRSFSECGSWQSEQVTPSACILLCANEPQL